MFAFNFVHRVIKSRAISSTTNVIFLFWLVFILNITWNFSLQLFYLMNNFFNISVKKVN